MFYFLFVIRKFVINWLEEGQITNLPPPEDYIADLSNVSPSLEGLFIWVLDWLTSKSNKKKKVISLFSLSR